MVKINISIQKKDLWLLSAIMIFLIGVGYVIAWNSGNPAIMGHSYNELQTCAEGKILKIVSGAWTCSDDIDTNTVSGLVTGGGEEFDDIETGATGCVSWGVGFCSANDLKCPAGTTRRTIKCMSEGSACRETIGAAYLCIRN